MQKHFLEMKEILTAQEDLDGIQPVFIRIAVTGKADAVSKKVKYTSEFAGKSHRDTHHICNHPNGTCSAEDISEDK